MNDILKHRGMTGSLEVDFGDHNLHGRVQGIDPIVYYEGATVEEAERHFREAVDDYIDWCRERGQEAVVALTASRDVA